MTGKVSCLIFQFLFIFRFAYCFLEINLKKLGKFGGVNVTEKSHELDAYVPLNKLRRTATFKLKLQPQVANETYNVFVRAERKADVFLGKFSETTSARSSNLAVSIAAQNCANGLGLCFSRPEITTLASGDQFARVTAAAGSLITAPQPSMETSALTPSSASSSL